jgi:hypothetical protein
MFRPASVKTFAKVKFRVPPTLMTIEICDIKLGEGGVRRALSLSLSVSLCGTETPRAVHLSVNAKRIHKHALRPTAHLSGHADPLVCGSATRELVTVPSVFISAIFQAYVAKV